MWKNRQRRWEKPRARILLSRRRRIHRYSGWSDRTRLQMNCRRRRSRILRRTASGPRDCGRLRSFWCTGGRNSADRVHSPMTTRKDRARRDVSIVERGLARSREKAQAMILAGEVRVNGATAAKAGQAVALDVAIEIHSRIQKYVSRGGFKLEGALKDFGVQVSGKICLDLGASNGGVLGFFVAK